MLRAHEGRARTVCIELSDIFFGAYASEVLVPGQDAPVFKISSECAQKMLQISDRMYDAGEMDELVSKTLEYFSSRA